MDLFDSLLKMVSALAVVVALLVLGSAGARRWLVRGLAPGGTTHPIRLAGVLALGGRRSIMVLQVGGRNLVVGATAQNLSLLAEFETQITAVPSPLPSPLKQGRGDMKGASSIVPLPPEGQEGQGEGVAR